MRVVTGRGSSPHTGKLLLSTFDQILISFEPIEAKTSTTIDLIFVFYFIVHECNFLNVFKLLGDGGTICSQIQF